MKEDCPRDATCVLTTSTILISTAREKHVYRSMREVPQGLRTKLLKCTNGPNAASVVIANRLGRQELARAIGMLPSGRRRSASEAAPKAARGRKRLPVRRVLASAVLLLSFLWLGLLFFRA